MSTQVSPFAPLVKENYASLTTFRKNGTAIATPMWFTERNGVIYISTGATSGKVKRIRNTSRVTLAPCTANGKVTGDAIEGQARIINDPQEIAIAEAALMQKYGIQRRVLYVVMRVMSVFSRQLDDRAYLAIEA
jgi:PPOX class probable F420-dependent enzyme